MYIDILLIHTSLCGARSLVYIDILLIYTSFCGAYSRVCCYITYIQFFMEPAALVYITYAYKSLWNLLSRVYYLYIQFSMEPALSCILLMHTSLYGTCSRVYY